LGESAAVEVVAQESVTANKSNGVIQNTAACSLTGTDSTARHGWLGALGHQTRVQLKIVDVSVQQLGCFGSLFVWVPLLEAAVRFQIQVSAES
jgi:hypothetical protein